MPEVDGFETYRMLQQIDRLKDIPIVFMTALTDSTNMLKAFAVGGMDYISKPFNFEEIKIRIDNHLRHQDQWTIIEDKAQEVETFNEELLALNEELQNSNEELFREINERQKVESELKIANIEIQKTIKELEEMQSFLIQTEKMAALGNLVAGLAHEINTPIGVALTASSHLEEMSARVENVNAELSENYIEDVKEASIIISKNLLKAGKLIRNFKLVSTDQSIEEKRRFNVDEYIEEVLLSSRPFTKKEKHQIHVVCDTNLEIVSYPGALAQILTNLIYNSYIHGFTDKHQGDIVITVTYSPDDNMLTLFYTDNGCGMEVDILNKHFDPFFTTNRSKGGSSLGMYIVYNIITQQLNGDIKVNSESGKGTQYTIKISA